MTINELVVSSEEQKLTLSDGYSADIKFDPFYKRWYYDLYLNNEVLYAGVALNPDSAPLIQFTNYSLGLIDKMNDKLFYEPFAELGSRLGLIEIKR